MTKTEQQLINARRACLVLVGFATGDASVILLGDVHREFIADLLCQFSRLDAKEQKQRKAGKLGAGFGHLGAEFGKRGGQPSHKKSRKAKVKGEI